MHFRAGLMPKHVFMVGRWFAAPTFYTLASSLGSLFSVLSTQSIPQNFNFWLHLCRYFLLPVTVYSAGPTEGRRLS